MDIVIPPSIAVPCADPGCATLIHADQAYYTAEHGYVCLGCYPGRSVGLMVDLTPPF